MMLGPLSVRSDGIELEIPAPRQRVVLATLLLKANQVVSVDRISAFVWDDCPPPSAVATVRTYVMRLRRLLGKQAGGAIETRASGYLMKLDEHQSDLGSFTAHRERAARHVEAGAFDRASAELSAALGLWRDEPLLDIPSHTLREVEGQYLKELRLQTLESRLDLDLALGRHAEIIPELWRAVREQPLREALVGRLMLALFRAGRQSEALAVFQRARTLLIDQLGAEPCSDLREMQRRILAADDPLPPGASVMDTVVATPPPVTVRGAGPAPEEQHPVRVRPAQLPAQMVEPAGRDIELSFLNGWLTTDRASSELSGVVVVTGGGGTGKSTLAVHAAHAVRGHFEDGQLYARLGGSDAPSEPGRVLGRFLAGLGVPPERIPADEEQAALLYRSLTADRRILVLLDDAVSAAQVRPLIPGGGGSRLIVTSRERLGDLDGARTITLAPLARRAALELLGSIIGHPRVEAEPRAAREVVEHCAGLPLAIRIAGARYLGRPHWDLARLARLLVESPQLLDELRIGDLAVRTSLDAGYRGLSDRATGGTDPAAAFRLLGEVGVDETDRVRAAGLFGCSAAEAEKVLEALADVHLLHADRVGCFHLDRLQRSYAKERAAAEPSPGIRALLSGAQ
ncbi:NB-ARC domain-containing protein [Streptomyces sp. RY43-2]|uniref:NB-ARC domain-containing protein n=1 Tax=Streptomyces macrolidinus TaxID=2952607 RepID=A0ABT0ZFT8_9ACTN|nr:AfsR/SARP family transcriptional regulator [Streptomyces macrolidinus]MCN9242437.1 NB-ARC domain-containing protein [Streptomyces macrolidinus]